MLVHEAFLRTLQQHVLKMHSNVTHTMKQAEQYDRVRARGGQIEYMQLFQKHALVTNRLRSAELVHIQANHIQSHHLTGTRESCTVVVENRSTTKQAHFERVFHATFRITLERHCHSVKQMTKLWVPRVIYDINLTHPRRLCIQYISFWCFMFYLNKADSSRSTHCLTNYTQLRAMGSHTVERSFIFGAHGILKMKFSIYSAYMCPSSNNVPEPKSLLWVKEVPMKKVCIVFWGFFRIMWTHYMERGCC